MLRTSLATVALLMISPLPYAISRCTVRETPVPAIDQLEDYFENWLKKTLQNNVIEKAVGQQPYENCGLPKVRERLEETYVFKSHLPKTRNSRPDIVSIKGGYRSPPQKWPWFVLLKTKTDTQKISTCGGTLIGLQWVLTAAHCISNRTILTITFGSEKRGISTPILPDETSSSFFATYVPDNFRNNSFVSDIALIKLQKPVRFSDYIRPVCLPESDMHFGRNDLCYSIGMGSLGTSVPESPLLSEIEQGIMSAHECHKDLLEDGIEADDSFLCADLFYLPGRRNHGDCQGDSGGPMSCLRKGRWYVAGVMSSSYPCYKKSGPDLRTNVSFFRSWIDSKVKIK